MSTVTFGGKWNDKTYNFEVLWYNENQVYLNRPFASKTITINRADAISLRDALNQYLEWNDPDHDEIVRAYIDAAMGTI